MVHPSGVIDPVSVIHKYLVDQAAARDYESYEYSMLYLVADILHIIETDQRAYSILDRVLSEDILNEGYPFKNEKPV